MYGKEVYEKTNWDTLQEPELRDCLIGPRPVIAEGLGELAKAAEKKLLAFLKLMDEGKINQPFVLNEDQIKVAKRMLHEVTRENFASIVNPEPCRSGKTRVTVLVILCLLEWILKANNGKILIISPLTATAAFTKTFTSFLHYFHSRDEIKEHCISDESLKDAKNKITFVTLQNVSKYKSNKFQLVVVDECHEVYTKSQQRQNGNNEEQIMEIVREICENSLLRIFMSGTIITNGFCDVYWLARLMGFQVGDYEYFYQNFSVVISRLFLTDAMKSRNAALYRLQALQQFDKLYEKFLRCIERVQTPFPTKRFYTFAFQKDVVTRDGEYKLESDANANDDSDTESYRRGGDDSETPDSSDDDILVARGGGGEEGGRRRGIGGGGAREIEEDEDAEEEEDDDEDDEDDEAERPTNDYACDRALIHIFQRVPYFAQNFLTMYLKRLHGIVPYAMKHHVENCMHAIKVYLDSAGQDLNEDEMEVLQAMANNRLKVFERVLQNCSTIILDNSLSSTIRVNIMIDRILHFVDEKKVKVVVTCDSVEMLHAFARILKEKSERLKAHGDSILFFTSEDAKKLEDRDDIIDQFRTDEQSYVLFASQIGSAGVSFAPASVLIKLDVCYKTHLEEQSSHRCNPLPSATILNDDNDVEENRVETIVTTLDVFSRVLLNELCAGFANMCGAGRRDGRSSVEAVRNARGLTVMNRATRQINNTDVYDTQLEYIKNFYAMCIRKYGNECLTEKTYGDERQVTMATLHMNEEQFCEVLSETPIPRGAKKEEKIKSVSFQGRLGNDRDGRGGGGGGGGAGGGAGRRVRLPKMQTGDSSLGYTIPYSDLNRTVENSLLRVVESINETSWDKGNRASRTVIINAIDAHNAGAASVEALKIDQAQCEIDWPDAAMRKNFKELPAGDYPLKCEYKGEVWENWRENVPSCSRHNKTRVNMFVKPFVTWRMMIGTACEQTALLALCKEKQLEIVREYSGVSFMHQEFNVSYSPDAVVYSRRERKLYVVEIKTSAELKSSALLGTRQRVKSGQTQLQLGMRLLNICQSGILVDFVLDKTTKRQSMRIEYFDRTSKVYTFRNGKRIEKNSEQWFKACHEMVDEAKAFTGKEKIEAWRSQRLN
jgi:superfamily II DNA or RNA helicase